MNSFYIEKLYIFSIYEKKARLFEFDKGSNVITSSKLDGNKVGKSILLKSIYHTLGADCYFDSTWDERNKIYIAQVNIADSIYQIYRYDKLFKIFKDNKIIFVTDNRQELGTYYADLFNFSIQLPSRNEDRLEITPPAYSFVLDFLDQDKLNGTSFDSFANLSQYTDYKENLLYSHFGVFNDAYYTLKKRSEQLKIQEEKFTDQGTLLTSMIDRIKSDIVNVDYSSDIEALNSELESNKEEYVNIISKLNNIKEKLIQHRNEREDLIEELKELMQSKTAMSKEIEIVNKHICPLCSSEISNSVHMHLRSEKYNSVEDLILLSNELEMELMKVNRAIGRENEKYSSQLELLNNYQSKIRLKTKDVDNIVTQQGAIEIRDTFIKELGKVQFELSNITVKLKGISSDLKKYADVKKNINQKYYEYMIADKAKFNLKEIQGKQLESITSTYKAQGSNKGIATTIWYYNLLKIKNRFNPQAIKFPLVLDGPTDVELDDDKKNTFLEYIFSNRCEGTQLIVSILGFNDIPHSSLPVDKIISIETPKYSLLTAESYEKYKDYLILCNNATLNEN